MMNQLNKKLISMFAISLALLIFVSAISYNVVYNDLGNSVFFNQTELRNTSFAISLIDNSLGLNRWLLNSTSGDFTSNVFYNSTSTFWNVTLGIASSSTGARGVNVSDPSLFAYYPNDFYKDSHNLFVCQGDNTTWRTGGGWGEIDTQWMIANMSYLGLNAGDTAWWNFSVSTTGSYYVYTVFERQSGYSSSTIPYSVTHDQGSTVTTVSHNANQGQWVQLGYYNFTAGTTYIVNSTANPRMWVGCIDVSKTRPLDYVEDYFGKNNGTVDISIPNLFTYGNTTMTNGWTEMTISTWVEPKVADDYAGLIVARGAVLNGLTTDSTGLNPAFWIGNTGMVGGTMAINKMSHLVGTWKNGTGMFLYINNVLVASGSYNGTINQDDYYKIGLDDGAAGRTFSGWISNTAFYNRSLSASEVSNLYKSQLTEFANTNITLQTRTANSYNITDIGLVALWGLNNGTNENATFFKDELGRNNGTCAGATCPKLTPNGTVGNAMVFDGDNDGINISDGSTFNSDVVSLSAWVKLDTVNQKDYARIIERGNGTGGIVIAGILVNQTNGFYMQVRRADESICTAASWSSGYAASANTWYNVIGIYNGSTANLYVNGVLWTSSSCSGITLKNISNGFFHIGTGTTQSWNGSIDEVRIYNRSLSAEEVQNLYNLGSYHLNWNNAGTNDGWTDSAVASDGVMQTTSTSGKFMQFKTNFYTNNSAVSPYLINHSALTFNSAPTLSSVSLSSTNVLSNETNQNLT
ncbi:MAG: LamG-like jellyroll fold domain-containing protein, partial [archaeon]|nr:LamG-like jellyroll fold domain-containing protein [archaeon]